MSKTLFTPGPTRIRLTRERLKAVVMRESLLFFHSPAHVSSIKIDNNYPTHVARSVSQVIKQTK